MAGLVKEYYEQLNNKETTKGKCMVLRKFLKDSTGFEINFGVLMKMIKLYGIAVVFNAAIAVNSKDFDTVQDLTSYLFGICRRSFIEEEVKKKVGARPELRPAKEVIKEIIEIDKELHGRNNSSRE